MNIQPLQVNTSSNGFIAHSSGDLLCSLNIYSENYFPIRNVNTSGLIIESKII